MERIVELGFWGYRGETGVSYHGNELCRLLSSGGKTVNAPGVGISGYRQGSAIYPGLIGPRAIESGEGAGFQGPQRGSSLMRGRAER